MTYRVIGADGGGTKTHALLAEFHRDSGKFCVLGEGIAAGSNPLSVGWKEATSNIQQAICEALSVSAPDLAVDSAVLAVAGCHSKETRKKLQLELGPLLQIKRYEVVPDTAPLFAESISKEPTVGVIAGTGSAILVRDTDDQINTFGGWGYLLGDEGSGYSIGRQMIRHILSEYEASIEPIAYERTLIEDLGISSPVDLKGWVYSSSNPRHKIASLAKYVIRLAEQGDVGASKIVIQDSKKLADCLAAALNNSEIGNCYQLLLAGSLLERSSFYRNAFMEAIDSFESCSPKSVKLAPIGACGCLRLAASR